MAEDGRRGGWGDWAVIALGIVLLIFGLPIFVLGIWLIALGGSWYYAPAGVGLVLTAWSDNLPAGGQATPITHTRGRSAILVITAGGHADHGLGGPA